MGFRMRKSFNLGGGFRINISKSGIGYSWGTQGFRITKTGKGTTRTTISIPGTGISYVNESGTDRKNFNETPPIDNNHYDTKKIENNIATEMVSNGLEEILAATRKVLSLNKFANNGIKITLLLWSLTLTYFVFAFNEIYNTQFFYAALILLSLLLAGFITLKNYILKKGQINLDYEIDADQKETVNSHMGLMLKLLECDKVWRIMLESKVIDKKYSGGAGISVERISCKANNTPPFPFSVNVPVASFQTKKETLLFLPDKLFIIQKTDIGALNYTDITTTTNVTSFIESEQVPKDAKIVRYTWQYVNKSGGPDRRFKNNYQIPICRYGEVGLKSESGLNTIIMCSNADILEENQKLIET